MEFRKAKIINPDIPVFTISIVVICAVSFLWMNIAGIFVYDRGAIINGEVWRLVTAHFVHFSRMHLFYNLIAFGMAGWLIEKKGYPYYRLLCLLMSVFTGLSLFIFKPDMAYYGGLSGIACGAFFYCALFGLNESGPWKTTCIIMVIVLPVKIGFEFYQNNSSVLPYFGQQTFVSMPVSHLTGVLTALLLFFTVRQNEGKKEKIYEEERMNNDFGF